MQFMRTMGGKSESFLKLQIHEKCFLLCSSMGTRGFVAGIFAELQLAFSFNCFLINEFCIIFFFVWLALCPNSCQAVRSVDQNFVFDQQTPVKNLFFWQNIHTFKRQGRYGLPC